MNYKEKTIQVIDKFYVECVEEFKEAELKILNDSKFRSIFRKKNYDAHISLLKDCKDRARKLRFPTGDIPKDDQITKDLLSQTEKCIRQFAKMCDAYIQMQVALKEKSAGAKLDFKEYNAIYRRSQEEQAAMNDELRELDILYSDYIEDEDINVYEFLK